VKAVILAGGKGRRLAPYTQIIPKPLLPIGDAPILEVLLRQMKSAGIEDIILAIGHLGDLLRAYFQDGARFGLHISYSYEESPLGTAGPLALVQGLEKTFLVTNGDVLTTLHLQDLIAFHRDQKAAATIAIHQRKAMIDLGVVQCDGGNRITGYVEKPSFDYLVSMGLYVFEPRVLSYIPANEYLDFPDLVQRLLDAGEKVAGFPFEGYWQDLGRPDDYERAAEDFETMHSQFLPER
jgi:NDP-sugar pyrophosphorylase family protein